MPPSKKPQSWFWLIGKHNRAHRTWPMLQAASSPEQVPWEGLRAEEAMLWEDWAAMPSTWPLLLQFLPQRERCNLADQVLTPRGLSRLLFPWGEFLICMVEPTRRQASTARL